MSASRPAIPSSRRLPAPTRIGGCGRWTGTGKPAMPSTVSCAPLKVRAGPASSPLSTWRDPWSRPTRTPGGPRASRPAGTRPATSRPRCPAPSGPPTAAPGLLAPWPAPPGAGRRCRAPGWRPAGYGWRRRRPCGPPAARAGRRTARHEMVAQQQGRGAERLGPLGHLQQSLPAGACLADHSEAERSSAVHGHHSPVLIADRTPQRRRRFHAIRSASAGIASRVWAGQAATSAPARRLPARCDRRDATS
jgi:hypothetical protein